MIRGHEIVAGAQARLESANYWRQRWNAQSRVSLTRRREKAGHRDTAERAARHAQLYLLALPLAQEQVVFWRQQGFGPEMAWMALDRAVPLGASWGCVAAMLASHHAAMMLAAEDRAKAKAEKTAGAA